MLVLLRSEADRHSVVMRTELAADLPPVSADRVQLQQVLMNLMLNGMEAMSERGGELTIRTRGEGGEVLVSVSDTGAGIPADMMEHIFNAFYHDQGRGDGDGAGDQPHDHRVARRPAVGDREPGAAARRSTSLCQRALRPK